MIMVIPLLGACILFAVGLLHVFWALGGRWGHRSALPQEDGKRAFSPGTGITLLVALLITSAGMILLFQSNLIDLPVSYLIVRIGAWVCAGVFALRAIGEFNHFGIFKKKRDTTFSTMDTFLYVPLCAFLSLAFIIAIVYGE
jgi:hypothetical protein